MIFLDQVEGKGEDSIRTKYVSPFHSFYPSIFFDRLGGRFFTKSCASCNFLPNSLLLAIHSINVYNCFKKVNTCEPILSLMTN